MKILLSQQSSKTGDLTANMARLESIVSRADADLVIFPELFLSGYMPRDDLPSMAEDMQGPTVSRLRELCQGTSKAVIVGLPMTHPKISGQVTNSALVFDQKGEMTRYDKAHLPTFGPFEEAFYFSFGNHAAVVELSNIKVGVMICYDIFFPELSKLMALRGADLLVCISASPTSTVENFKKVIPARAIENAAYVAYVNCVGTHLDLVFGGMSRLVDPRGDIAAEARALQEELVSCEVDIAKIEMARRVRPTLRDTRKEIIEAMVDELRFGSGAR